MMLVALISIGGIGTLWITQQYFHFINEAEKIRAEQIESREIMLMQQVQSSTDYINFKRSQAVGRVNKNIKDRVYEAHTIATHIYNSHKHEKTPEELKAMVRETLRQIRFNDGRGYYFATSLKGIEQLFTDRPELEGKNLINMQDSQGAFVIQDMIKIVQNKGEDFYSYRWTKPDEEGKKFRKISFIKLFEPFDWFIGTGEYLDDMEKAIQQEVLARISEIKFGRDGYVFAGQWNGLSLSGPSRGENMYDIVDSNGVKIVQDLISMAKGDGGFVSYVMPKLEGKKPEPKLSYSEGVQEWQWYVGAGMYIDDIEKGVVGAREKAFQIVKHQVVQIIFFLVVLLSVSALISFKTMQKSKKAFNALFEFFQKASTESVEIDPDKLTFNEFQQLAVSANQMLMARKQVEEDLRKTETRQALILRSLPMAFYVAQPFDTYGGTWVSEQIKNISGFSPEQFSADINLWADRLHPDDRDWAISEFDKITDGPISIEYRWLAANNSYHWFHDEAVLIRDENGNPKEIIGSWLDITERRQEQQDLHLTKHTVDQSPLPVVWLLDADKVVYANSSACNILGYSLEEMLAADTNLLHPKGTNEYKEKYLPLLKTKKFLSLDITFRKKDGTIFPVLATPSYLLYAGKEYVIITFLDLTEKKKMEESLLQAQKMESIGTLAGGIAHDFNNILSAIFGYSDMALINMDDREALRNNIGEVKAGAERAKNLVRQILTFSRSAEEDKQPLQISLVAKEALKLLRSSIPSTIEVKQDITSKEVVIADSTQIHQVIMNLCTNAYHAMRETGGILSVTMEDIDLSVPDASGLDLAPGKYIHLEISDTGVGMDKETKEKVFDPYFTTKEVGEGTGLGLAVVHGIVQSHNGRIDVFSQPDHGTTFHLYFPVAEKVIGEVLPKELEAPATGGNEKIMFIDDEKNIVDIAREIFTRHGYTVFTYTNGVQALQDFQQKPDKYDLLITDMTMPYMTGTQLAQKIMEIRPNLSIILCTGHSALTNREKALRMGIKEYCEKPLDVHNLLRTVRKVLDQENIYTKINA